jgi:hypothetical protein
MGMANTMDTSMGTHISRSRAVNCSKRKSKAAQTVAMQIATSSKTTNDRLMSLGMASTGNAVLESTVANIMEHHRTPPG